MPFPGWDADRESKKNRTPAQFRQAIGRHKSMSNATHSTTAVRLHLVIRVDGRVWSLLECRDGSWQSSTRYRPCDEPISTDQGPHTEASILDLFTPLGDGELEIINRREI